MVLQAVLFCLFWFPAPPQIFTFSKHSTGQNYKFVMKTTPDFLVSYVTNTSEKRQQFDNGEDPLDPETEQGKNFHQHFHGFPFGGQQFHFKFN